MTTGKKLVSKNQLASFAMTAYEKKGLRPDIKCKSVIERHIGLGVERMITSKLIGRADKKLLAESNLVTLLDCMEKHARMVGAFPALDLANFQRAKRELGLLWPYF